MMIRAFAAALGASLGMLPLVASQTTAAFNPVGSWRVSTASDEGQPMSVAVEIAGKPGAFTGEANTGQRVLPLTDLATTPTGFIAFFALPEGFIVVRLSSRDGKFNGSWGELTATYPLTAERGR